MSDDELNILVGTASLPYDAQTEVAELIAVLNERYEFKNGTTAAFLEVSFALSRHLGEGKP